MLKEDRHKNILNLLKMNGSVTTADLCERYKITRQTIHNDLEELNHKGKLKKVYGGAISASKSQEPSIEKRRIYNKEIKNKIRQVASSFVQENDTIFLDASTTVDTMIPYLGQFKQLTIITHSIGIAYQLGNYDRFKIHMIGGLVRPQDLICTGYSTVNQLKDIYVDKAFFGMGGVSIQSGFTDYHFTDSDVRKVIIKNSTESYALFDTSKVETVTIAKFADIHEIDTLISSKVEIKDFLIDIKNQGLHYIDAQEYQVDLKNKQESIILSHL